MAADTFTPLTLTIGGASAVLEAGSFDLEDRIATRSQLSFSVIDHAGTSHYKRGQPILITDSTDGSTVYAGYVWTSKEKRMSVLGGLMHHISAVDSIYLADKRLAIKSYSSTLAGDIVSDLVSSYLAAEGVIGQHAKTSEASQSDFNAGTLTRVAGQVAGGLALVAPGASSYARASVATRASDGVQVGSGFPRFEPGGLASSTALRIEEGTTNLLSANQSSVETDTTGFTAIGGPTMVRDAATAWTGSGSLKVTTSGGTFQGAMATVASASLAPSTSYTISVWVKGSGTVELYARNNDTGAALSSLVSITLSGTWTRYSASFTTPASLPTNGIGLTVDQGNTTQSISWWMDGLQFEQRSYATTWQIGGTARVAEQFSPPASGTISASAGTIEFRAYFDATVRRAVGSTRYYLFGLGPANSSANALNFYHDSFTGFWTVGVANGSTSAFSGGIGGLGDVNGVTTFANGWHHIALAWDASSLLVYVDGVQKDSITSPPMPATMPASCSIGSDSTGANQVNTLYQELRISGRKRTAAEIATDAAASTLAAPDRDTAWMNYLDGATLYVGGYRVSPALSLANVGTVRAATVSWTQVLNGGTIGIETSVDGGATWQTASNGGSVSGLTYQGSDYVDGFDTDTSANYTASAGGVFAWDTANSRIVATGGSAAKLSYSGATYTYVDATAETDYADSGGVWVRFDGTSTGYLVRFRDASGDTGWSAHSLTLYKSVSGVLTSLGTADVSWTRGAIHRVKLSAQGTALKVFFDDAQVISATDAAITAAGRVALAAGNAGGQVTRFLSLTIQSGGPSVAGVSILLRESLISSSGDVSPVLNSLTLSVRSTYIEDGPTINNALFGYARCSDCIDKLAEVADFWWNIGHDKHLTFRARSAWIAPRVVDGTVTSGSVLEDEDSVELDRGNESYRNQQYLTGGTDITALQTESRKGDGITRSFTLSYPLARVPTSVTVNGAAKTLGIKGLDSGKDWYWSKGDAVLAQDSGGTLLTSSDTLQVQYYGMFDTVYVAQDGGQVTTMQALEGGGTTGLVEAADQVSGLDNATALSQFASGRLKRYALEGDKLTFRTTVKGFKAGQVVLVYVPWHDLNGVQMLIESVKVQDVDGLHVWYSVTAVVGPFDTTWPAFWLALAQQGADGIDTVTVGQSGTLVVPVLASESHGHSESVSVTSYAVLYPSPTLYPATGQYP